MSLKLRPFAAIVYNRELIHNRERVGEALWVGQTEFEPVESQFGRLRGCCACLLARGRQSSGVDYRASDRVLYLERADVYRALDATGVGPGDGLAASFLICHEPDVRDAGGSYGAARNQPRPAGSVGRGIFPV